jgi:hypothetical protein
MQRIYEPLDLMEGELLLTMLASEGIEAHLSGRHLLGGIGELPLCGLLGVMVEDRQAERAQQLIATYNAAQPLPSDEPEDTQGVLIC